MKRFCWLLLLTALCLGLVMGLACVANAEETKPTCEECGGVPDFSSYEPVDENFHVRACPHGVIDPDAPLEKHFKQCDSDSDKCDGCGQTCSGDYVEVHDAGGSSGYQSNETEHWIECARCQEKVFLENHWANCNNPNVCAMCGHAYSGDDIAHYFSDEYQSDETEHWLKCVRCSAIEREAHWAYCDNPNVCAVCGQPYSGDKIVHKSEEEIWQFDETQHWQICSTCGKEMGDRQKHYASCIEPGICMMCGSPCSGEGIHYLGEYHFNETEHWRFCNNCGEEVYRAEHIALCNNLGVCTLCGVEYSGNNIGHNCGDWEFDETEHWAHCLLCGDEFWREAHAFDENGVCKTCSFERQAEEPHEHVWTVASEKAATCQEAGSITYVCSGCGEQYSEPLEKLEHDWQFTSHTDPTCTSQGEDRYTCTLCGYYYTDKIPMLAHEFGAFESQRDGDHAAVCAVCGVENREPCVYDENGVCTVCGYVKPTVEPTVVAEVVKTVQETVAQAQTSDVPEALLEQIVVTTETLEDDTLLVVSDQSALLPEDSGVLCLFNVEVTENDQPIAVAGTVRVKLPWTQGPDVTLYRLTDDGKLVEIPFEYDAENALILFETDTLGSFVILPKA